MLRSDARQGAVTASSRRRRGVAASIAIVLASIGGVVGMPSAALADGPTTFSNTTSISVPAAGSPDQIGSASPYPSAITVSGMTGVVTAVQVVFRGLTHSTLNDVDALVVAPSGENLVVLSDVGDAASTLAFANDATLTFDDSASGDVPTGNVSTGSYRPTNGLPADSFPAPAPPPSAQSTLGGAFTGIDPNGAWQLFVVDDATGDVGTMAGGWSVVITTEATAVATTTTVSTSGSPSATGSPVTFTATVTAAGAPVTAGTVAFTADGAPLGAVAVSGSGVAQITTTGLAEGTRTIIATYSGASGFLTSNASVTQRVDNATVVTGSTYCNPGALTIPDSGVAAPYPSNISVSGLSGPVSTVTATLNSLSHAVPVDLDILLSGPVPTTNLVLMSDVGGTSPVAGATLIFDDAAVGAVPTPLTSGTFRPTDDDTDGVDAAFPAPAPVAGAATTLSTFTGASGNGVWSLWIVDDATGDAGSLNGGWCLTFTTAAPPIVAVAGGPYDISEGESLALDGSGSTPGVAYGWDIDGDADFTDATGATPTLTWAQLESLGIDDGPASHSISLQVTLGGQQATDDATLDVANTAPETVVTGARTATVDVPFTLKVGADDPSSADMAALFDYTVDWGDGSPVVVVVGPADPPVTHVYDAPGTYAATFTSTDKDGGTGEPLAVQVLVSAAPLSPPPSPSPPAAARVLPPTGADPSRAVLLGSILLLAGAMLITGRRRRSQR